MLEKEQNSKIIGNAISAYLMIFVSGMFLFNKSNPLLNNNFVKTHTKSALLIHVGFFVTYLIFISNSIFSGIQIGGFALNYIIASICCIALLGMLLFGIYRSSQGEYFTIGEIIKVSKVQSMVHVNNENSNLDERSKLNILLSYIPFVSFYITPKHLQNENIVHASRGNLFLTVILILLYNFGYVNIVLFVILLYTIYVVFVGINLFASGNVIQIRFSKIFSPSYKFDYTYALCKYLKAYIGGNELKTVQEYLQEVQREKKEYYEQLNDQILSLPDLKLPKFAIYIPLINIFYIFLRNNRYYTHIRNGIVISVLFIFSVLILKFSSLSYGFLYLYLIVAIYGIGYIHSQPVYKMPYIYVFYTAFEKITNTTRKANSKYNVEKNITLKVEEK